MSTVIYKNKTGANSSDCPTANLTIRKLTMVVAIVLIAVSTANAQGTSGPAGPDLNWEYNAGTKTLTFIGSGEMYNQYYHSSPWFHLAEEVETLALPAGLTRIGDLAFRDFTALKGDLIIPSTVIEIGEGAFYECTGLTGDLVIPNATTIIEDVAFSRCHGFDGTLTLGNSLEIIDVAAFSGCDGFTGELIFPASITLIDEQAFMSCSNLSGHLTIPGTMSVIKEMSFSGCSSFTGLTIPGSVTTIERYALSGGEGFTGTLDIPESVTEVMESAFWNCGFTGLNIPNSLTTIGVSAFSTWNSLTFINVGLDNPVYSSANGVLFNKEKSILMQYPRNKAGAYIIPNSVTTVKASAFELAKNLTSVTIGNLVTEIGEYAFYGCSGLTSITNLSELPQTIEKDVFGYIYDGTFYGTNIEDVILYVPETSIALYEGKEVWKDFKEILPYVVSIDKMILSEVNVYTNPATATVTISNAAGADLKIINMVGETVGKVNKLSETEKVSMNNLASGIYIFHITKEGKVKTVKIIKN
jgi:hypothetical protein